MPFVRRRCPGWCYLVLGCHLLVLCDDMLVVGVKRFDSGVVECLLVLLMLMLLLSLQGMAGRLCECV